MVNHHSNGGSVSGDDRNAGEERVERIDFDPTNKPTYLLEHLATFTVNKDSGIIFPADGMRRLLQLEKTTGIWSQKMQLCLDYQWVLIMDYETGNIIERFPASLIQEPTAFTSNDAMELYNNILVFIVSGGSGSRSEMHIFQSQSISAVHLVEDMKNLRNGKMVMQQRESTPTQHPSASGSTMSKSTSQSHNRTSQHHAHQQQQQLQHQPTMHQIHQRRSEQYDLRGATADVDIVGINHSSNHVETDSEHGGPNDETSSTSSEKYERDVAVLNHCFDDIEKFIARLQHAAAALRELERRRRNRKSKKRDPGEGLLTLRTRPPHEKEFIDIFAKFKLSFNLLAKLKAHIHDPNAPELVHFLFTPLALIVEASSDTYYESQLPARVVNPLLTREAINLLINCVTSKETELWRSLGDAWVIPRDQWKDDMNVGSYHPVFLDGWSPDYLVIDELESPTTPTNISKRRLDVQAQNHGMSLGINGRNAMGAHGHNAGAHNSGVIVSNYDDYDTKGISLSDKYTIHHCTERSDRPDAVIASDFNTRSELSCDSNERSAIAPTLNAITAGLQNLQTRESRNANTSYSASNVMSMSGGNTFEIGFGSGARGIGGTATDDQVLESWLEDLQTSGAKVVLVTYPRTANNDKELSVARGEYLEILDDTRKWWKARNMRGQIAHVPHTIVTPYNYGESETDNQYYGQQASSKHKLVESGNLDNMESRSSDTTEMIRNKHLGKKGEFRYF